MSSEAALSSSQLKAAVPAKRGSVEEKVQMIETMEVLNETRDKLDRVRKTLVRTEEDRDMWRRLIEGATRSRDKR